ncbi:hypothetical protein P43SY_008002 [Pythium insidiosum]|uniref:GH18 domain-containing protein n=1 Tax=Pythium insidiosum TaxID=114742 RepID=A0AAD5Q9Q0_PYTIN|nr:hypothetical protein P43SY_008002 [Pythium insidiosum]
MPRAADLDASAYHASDHSLSPSSASRRGHREPGARRARLLKLFSGGPVFLIAAVIVIVFVVKGGKDDNSNGSGASSSAPKNCGAVRDASQRTVVFWQSEVAGCEKVPDGVTHVVFGFALVDSKGRVTPTFQTSDATIKRCVESLKAIGGSTNNAELSAATDSQAFATSALAVVDKFGFDGLDIDDETVGAEFNATHAVGRVQATRAALRQRNPSLLLSYDVYVGEGEPSFCQNEANKAYTRCFPKELLASVDWINIMAYNVNQDSAGAAAIYDRALNTTFVDWAAQLDGDWRKATIGVCVSKSCAYGPGPSAAVIKRWDAFARQPGHGGMMVYAASGEVAEDFPVTRSVVPSGATS